MTKAKVFPPPVFDAPNTSSPRKATPIDSLWISVGSKYSAALSPSNVFLERGKFLNVLIFAESGCKKIEKTMHVY